MGDSWTQIYGANIPGGCIDITGDFKEEYTIYVATDGRGVLYGVNNSITGLFEPSINNQKSGIKINPNPVSGEFELELPEFKGKEMTIQFFDLTGKKIASIKTPNHSSRITLNTNSLNLTNGLYFIRAFSDNNQFTGKLIVKK